ncbi:MAG: hypothetical protein QM516_12310, partial [Limnohabitans sp.]|nr:hypothetical protein [Limnohabitans sp.]
MLDTAKLEATTSVDLHPSDVMPSRRAFVATIAALGATSAVAAKSPVSSTIRVETRSAGATGVATSFDTGITELSLRE